MKTRLPDIFSPDPGSPFSRNDHSHSRSPQDARPLRTGQRPHKILSFCLSFKPEMTDLERLTIFRYCPNRGLRHPFRSIGRHF